MKPIKVILIACLFVVGLNNVCAEDIRYISDQFEITLHQNKNPNSKVLARLTSGATVEILQIAGVDGYAKVKTIDNKTGWVLESFLMPEPSGRDQYLAIKKEYEKLKKNFDTQVRERTQKLSSELAQLRKISKRPQQLHEENQRLKKMLDLERKKFEEIAAENRAFKSIHKDRAWLVTGSLIAIGSLVLGLIITKIPWRRRKSWGEV